LRRAFDDTMKDPAYIEKMRAAKIQFNPMSGEELARNVAATVGAPKSGSSVSRRPLRGIEAFASHPPARARRAGGVGRGLARGSADLQTGDLPIEEP